MWKFSAVKAITPTIVIYASWLLIAVGVGLVSTGCSSDDEATGCTQDSDCSGNGECREGTCVAPASPDTGEDTSTQPEDSSQGTEDVGDDLSEGDTADTSTGDTENTPDTNMMSDMSDTSDLGDMTMPDVQNCPPDSSPCELGCCQPAPVGIVESMGDVGRLTSIAVDPSGYPHIAFLDVDGKEVKYTRWNGQEWLTERVDSSITTSFTEEAKVELVLDSNDRPQIVYYQGISGDLKIAQWTGTEWTRRTIEDQRFSGRSPSFALNADDDGFVTYLNGQDADLMLASVSPGVLKLTTLDSAGLVGRHSSVAADALGFLHVSYYDATNEDLKYAVWEEGMAMDVDPVVVDGAGSSPTEVGEYSSLAVSSDGTPHIVYYDATNSALLHARSPRSTSAWYIQRVDNDGNYPDVVTNENDEAIVTYYDVANGDLKLAGQSSNWTTETLDGDTADVGRYSSIALGDDALHISYYDVTNGDLKYLRVDL